MLHLPSPPHHGRRALPPAESPGGGARPSPAAHSAPVRLGHVLGTPPPLDDLGAALHFVSREPWGLAGEGLQATGSHCWLVPRGRPRRDWRELEGMVLAASLRLPAEGGAGGDRGAGGLPLVLAAGSRRGAPGRLLGFGLRVGSGLQLLGPLGCAHILRSCSGAEGPARRPGALRRSSHPFVVVFPELVVLTGHEQ